MARITVVNDYGPFLHLARDMLGEADHEVATFDGKEASIGEIARSKPDLLIIDVLVESAASTGWDVIALARSHEALKSVPILAATSDDLTPERLDELRRFGNIYVLEKPFEPSSLYTLVDRALGATPA